MKFCACMQQLSSSIQAESHYCIVYYYYYVYY